MGGNLKGNWRMNGWKKGTLTDLLLVYSIMLVQDGADGVLNREKFLSIQRGEILIRIVIKILVYAGRR